MSEELVNHLQMAAKCIRGGKQDDALAHVMRALATYHRAPVAAVGAEPVAVVDMAGMGCIRWLGDMRRGDLQSKDGAPLYMGAPAVAGVPEGMVLVPVEPTKAMLRPFYECPPDELGLAWSATLAIAAAAPSAPSVAHEADKRMFSAAVESIAQISGALGIPDDLAECANGNSEILAAISRLKSNYDLAVAGRMKFRDALRDSRKSAKILREQLAESEKAREGLRVALKEAADALDYVGAHVPKQRALDALAAEKGN